MLLFYAHITVIIRRSHKGSTPWRSDAKRRQQSYLALS